MCRAANSFLVSPTSRASSLGPVMRVSSGAGADSPILTASSLSRKKAAVPASFSQLTAPMCSGSRVRHDPDAEPGAQRRDVGHQLAEMVVVAALKLVLDHDNLAGAGLTGHIDAERASTLLAG